jgi:hypothetical protein
MRLDHVSYVASHDQISDVVQRIGSQIGTAFVDGGIHPRFGTRNFTAPLLNGQYIEVVCPLDHPAAEQTPFGKAVTRKANEGGGWLSWVFSTEDLAPIEAELGRKAVEGHRRRPDGTELTWKQIGIIELLDSADLPFFIQWESSEHPCKDGKPAAAIKKIEINIAPKNREYIESIASKSDNLNISNLIMTINNSSEIDNGITQITFTYNGTEITIE